MSDTFSNFPSWWIEYSKDKTGAEWEIDGHDVYRDRVAELRAIGAKP